MPVTHILVMLNGHRDAASVRHTIQAAYDQAASPVGLRFAVPDAFQAALTAEDEVNAELPQSSLLFFEDHGKLDILPSLTTEESFSFLCWESTTLPPCGTRSCSTALARWNTMRC